MSRRRQRTKVERRLDSKYALALLEKQWAKLVKLNRAENRVADRIDELVPYLEDEDMARYIDMTTPYQEQMEQLAIENETKMEQRRSREGGADG